MRFVYIRLLLSRGIENTTYNVYYCVALLLAVQPRNNPTSATTALGTPPMVQLRCTHCGTKPPASDVVAMVHSIPFF
jgi:hypothetical protein